MKRCAKCKVLTNDFLEPSSICGQCEFDSFRELGRIPENVTMDSIRKVAKRAGEEQAKLHKLRKRLNCCANKCCSNKALSNSIYCELCLACLGKCQCYQCQA